MTYMNLQQKFDRFLQVWNSGVFQILQTYLKD